MKKRETLIEMFSTFLKVDDYKDSLGPGWETDFKLKLSLSRRIEADLTAKEEFWAQYFLQEALQNPHYSLSKSHLCAYLEEVCYWTTIKVLQQLTDVNLKRVDCFLIAREASANPAKLFKRYDSKRSRVKTYAQFPLRNAVVEKIRVGSELQKYTPPALLRVVSKKQLKEALQKADINELESSKYLLAWQCFCENYVPTTAKNSRQLQPPNAEQLAVIAECYNQRSERLKLKQSVSNQEIERLLEICVQVVREGLTIRFVPLEEGNSTSELILAQPVDEQETLADELHQIRTVLTSEFPSLPEDAKKILTLWYSLRFKQADMAIAFGLKQQYQVSRKIGKCQQSLLKALASWSAESLQISLSSVQLQAMAVQIDEWLQGYCSAPLHQFLQTILLENLPDKVELLRLTYGQNLNTEAVAIVLNIEAEDVKDKIAQIKAYLQEKLKSHLENSLQINLNSLSSTTKQIAAFVENWLQNAPYATFR